MVMEVKNTGVVKSKKVYENAVESFFMETRGKMKTYDAVGALGALLYLSKIGRLRVLDITEVPEDLVDHKEAVENNYLRISMIFLGRIYQNIHSHCIMNRMLNYVMSIKKEYIQGAFEFAMRKLTTDKDSTEFIQPLEIGQLALEMVKGMELNVYNPFSGMMSYATQLDNYKFMRCVDINERGMTMGILRLSLNDKGNKVASRVGDVANWDGSLWDLIIATPPFGTPITMADSQKKESADAISLSRFEKSTSNKGQLFTIVPASFLWANDNLHSTIRKNLVEKDFIDTIVMLPSKTFFPTAVNTAIVYLSKQKEHEETINIVDASDCFNDNRLTNIIDVNAIIARLRTDNKHKLSLSKEEIAEHDYKLDFLRYQAETEISVPEGDVVKKFAEVAQQVFGEQHFNEEEGYLVSSTSFGEDKYNCLRKPDDFEKSDSLHNAKKIKEPVLLINTGRQFKSFYITASEKNPVFINPMVMAFHVETDIIEPEYLCLELSRRKIPSYGNAVSRVDISELNRTPIVMPPSLEAQKREFDELAKAYKLAKARELGLQDFIESMKAEYINEVRMRKHDMRPFLRNIAAEEKLMRYYVENMQSNEGFTSNMLEVLNNCRNDINQLSTLLENLSKEEKFCKPELVNIDSYLSDSLLLQDTEKYTCDYNRDDEALDDAGLLQGCSQEEIDKAWNHIDELKRDRVELPDGLSWSDIAPGEYPDFGPKLLVSIAPADLDRIVENIVSNSVNHGFTDPERDDYNIWVTLSFDENHNMFVIDFIDNGKPLPKGMDKERYGLRGEKARATAGTGLGGSIVKEIVKHYGGDYDVFSNNRGTTVRIWLPVAKTEEN